MEPGHPHCPMSLLEVETLNRLVDKLDRVLPELAGIRVKISSIEEHLRRINGRMEVSEDEMEGVKSRVGETEEKISNIKTVWLTLAGVWAAVATALGIILRVMK